MVNKNSMKAILIDTTSSKLGVALIDGKSVFSSLQEVGKSGHSTVLMPVIDTLLKENKVSIDDIDTIGVVVGPGSFTGIRIGVATATALAFSLNAKRIAITAFELLAYNREKAIVAVDAGHGNLYVANCENGEVKSTDFIDGEEAKKVDRSQFDFDPSGDYVETLVAIASKKVQNKDYVSVFEPYYMRKSQAEREKGL